MARLGKEQGRAGLGRARQEQGRARNEARPGEAWQGEA